MRPLHLLFWSTTIAVVLLVGTSIASATDLTGVVLDESGRPVPEITVKLITSEMWALQPVPLDETKTDEAGRFRMTVPQRWLDYPAAYRQELTLLAGSRELGMGGIVVSRQFPLPGQKLTVSLEPWSSREVKLVDADGHPMRDIEMKLRGLRLPLVQPSNYIQTQGKRWIIPLPEGYAAETGRTNADGIATMLLPPNESVGSLSADLGGGVTLTWSVIANSASIPKDWSRRLQLPQLTQIPLKINAEPGEALKDLTLTVGTTPRQSQGTQTTIQQSIKTDADGAATITSLDNSVLHFHPAAPHFPDWRLDRSYLENTSAIDADGVRLNFRKAITVTGRLVTNDGAPASRVRLFVMDNDSGTPQRTGKDGRFESLGAAGQQMVVLVTDPGYRGPSLGPESLIGIPADARSFTIPDIVVARLVSVTGRVTGSDGLPVADSSVVLLWDEPHPQAPNARINRQEIVQTDAEGRFRLAGIDPDTTLRIAAWHGAAASHTLRQIPPESLSEPVDLTLSPANTIAVVGRVVDQTGDGLPGLPIVIRHRIDPPLVDAGEPVGEDVAELTTDEQGHFTTSQALVPWGEYIAIVRVGTQQEAASGWKSVAAGSELELPKIVTSASTSFTGRVVTTGGEPIPAATVHLLTSIGQSRTTTDIDGRFSVDAVGGRGPLLIASADGFLSNGIELQSLSENASIVLTRPGEHAPDARPAADLDVIAPAMSTEERRSLAVKLYETLPDSDLRLRTRALAVVARIDPDYVLKRLEDLPASDPNVMNVRRSLAMAIAPEKPAEALELVDEAVPDTTMRQYLLLSVEPRAGLDDGQRRELLARIVQDARGIGSPDHRVLQMGFVGERLLDLGERESGEALLREGQALAENLAPAAWSGYARGAFAEELAQVDADAALALIEPLTDVDEYNRHLTNIAHELAPIDPKRAADILDLMRESQRNYVVKSRDGAVIRVCYRMIRVDPDRGVALAGSVGDDVMRVRCLGVMADSLLARDEVTADSRARAARILSDAWEIVTAYPDSHDQSEVAWLFPSTMAALLLPATAELFPQELRSRIWQTIALRRPMEKSGPYVNSGSTCAGELALLLAEIDPVQARRVAAWVPDCNSGETAFRDFVQGTRSAAEMIAAITPEQIEPSLAALRDDDVTLSFISALSRSGESHRRAICNDLGLWFPDDEDMGPMD